MANIKFAKKNILAENKNKKIHKILIVDDDKSVHDISAVAIMSMKFSEFTIEILSAYSAKEAKIILSKESNIALALIDVVMETPEAGLELVNYIRDELENNIIRLIIRTGQANDFPQIQVIQQYDINDFKEKTELTIERLYTTIRSSLKQFEQLIELETRVKEEVDKNRDKDKQLLSQSRLAQMGEMISMIAHQWRQPLASIASIAIDMKFQSEFEKFDLGKKQDALKYEAYINNRLDTINLFVQNLTTTIDDFRNFYKPNKESVTVKLEEVISKSLTIMKESLINDNIKIVEEYDSQENLKLYKNEMMQVILNLLKNAQDNFKEKEIKNPYIKISIKNKIITIYDNGGGIPEDIIDKIFDPYFSTKTKKNGTGLGLYMSKIIVEEHHNAKLSARNIDDGICFTIEFR